MIENELAGSSQVFVPTTRAAPHLSPASDCTQAQGHPSPLDYAASTMDIRLATRDDVAAMMSLESLNYVGNLTASDRAGGFISMLHPQTWFETAVDAAGMHVAVTGEGEIAGFIAVTPPPIDTGAHNPPIIDAMLALAETLTVSGRPIAQQRYAIRGPVIIDRAARGQGLYTAFNAVTCDAYRDRFDFGVLFVSADNPRSLHTTTTKLGARSLAVFEVNSRQYHFMAFNFR